MNKYGRFFLVYEEDEEITVKPNKRSIDYTADVEEPVEDNPDNAEEPIEEPAGDDNNVDATAEDEPVDTEIDDDTDYTADIGDDGTPVEDNAVDNNTTDDGTEPTEPTKLKPGLEYDSTRRYKLFCRFKDLLSTCDAFIERLQKMTTDNQDTSRVIDNGIKKISEVRKLTHDYMILRFISDSYVQAMLYYDKLIIILNDILNSMKCINKISDK